jgi:MFS family permease
VSSGGGGRPSPQPSPHWGEGVGDPSPLGTQDSGLRTRRLFHGWKVVFAAICANFAYAEQYNSSYGIFVQAVGADTGWSRSVLSGVQTIGRLPEVILPVLLGPVVDRHGARWLVGLGGLVVGGAFMTLALIQEVWQLYLIRGFITAAGSVGLGTFLGTTISNWFVAKRGRALGFLSMGNAAANGLVPLLAAWLVEQWGWRVAWFWLGALIMLLAVPAVIFFRRRPEDVGLHPDGVEPSATESRSGAAGDQRRRTELLAADVVWTRGQILRQPTFWFVSLAFGISYFALSATNLHLIPYLNDMGYALTLAAAAIGLRAAVGFFGSPGWGFALERLPLRYLVALPFIFQALAMLPFLLSPTAAGLVVAMVLYGVGYAGTIVMAEFVWAYYFGRLSLGAVRSVYLPINQFLGAVGPLVAALMFDYFHTYNQVWVLLVIGFTLAAVLVQLARRPNER